jgi:hypothetical protein
MDDDNKYHWTFRETVGRGFRGNPIYHRYSFDSLSDLIRTIFYFKYQMIQRIYRRGWKNRWEV